VQIAPFELERWQSVWEHRVELNISESGVLPLSFEELVERQEDRQRILAQRLGYPQTNGSEELRANIAALYPGARPENVLVTCGCSEANFIVTWSQLEAGDEVVFMLPNYMQVGGLARAFGATVKPLWLREQLRWAPDLDELRRLVTPKTRLIAICNPNNPTGAVLGEKAIEEICAVASKVGAWILADEVYRGAEFDGKLSPSFWGRYDRALCTAGFSKAFGLPGLRTGWVLGPPKTVESLWGYHDYTSIGPAMLTDRLAALALEPVRCGQILERTCRILRENYPIVGEWVGRHADLFTHVPPRAGAIAWIGSRKEWNTAELAEALRSRKGVLIVPGEQLGMESYFRIGFGYGANHLHQALARVDEMLAEMAGARSAQQTG
jgi:aspartate/methionine/tyrosine aminotransferase